MARPQLSKEAIAFIIECRDNPKEVYTWQDIADLVADKFGVKLSFQAIAKSYHRNKGKVTLNIISSIEPVENTAKNTGTIQSTKPHFKRKTSQQNTSLEAIFTRGENIDLKDLFDKAE